VKFEINDRFSGKVVFTCDIDASFEVKSDALKKGEAIKKAVSGGADLSYANLRGVNLGDADLGGANLSYVNLSYANLRGVNLGDADLGGANLSYVNLSYANLRDADLGGVNLRGADLSYADLSYANLSYANLRDADLGGVNLRGADLSYADLSYANLSYVNLRDADLGGVNLGDVNLRGANFRGANLRGANLDPIKRDMFDVLLRAIPEIPLLEKAILGGKIEGTTYEGECACLCGTIEKSKRFEGKCDMRDGSRPIERFFLGISAGDTPENNQFSKLSYEWIQEFKGYINQLQKGE